MSYKYIRVPNTITFENCQANNFVFAPSKYSRFIPTNSELFVPLSRKCIERKDKIKVNRRLTYSYSEIGDIDVNNGTVDFRTSYGLNLPSENPKKCCLNDILISTVRSYRGGFGMLSSSEENHCCSPAIIVIEDVTPDITKEYLLAILRSDFFIEQILGFQTRGMYPRLDNNAMDNIVIPIPENNSIQYISVLMRAYLNKHELIKQRHADIMQIIDEELKSNQIESTNTYQLPTLSDLQNVGRLDTGLYSKLFKDNIARIQSYTYGYYENIFELGYQLSRGQNLQESNIGKSIYSEHHYDNFYTLALPTNFTKYGTIAKTMYLGNPHTLKTLSKGEIIFGAEATFRGFVVCDDADNCITNIHGVTISNNHNNIEQSIFVKCFLDYVVGNGVIDAVKVGGHGGSFAQKYWNIIPFPKFPLEKQKEIATLYHNPAAYEASDCAIESFLEYDSEYNSKAGIYELDKTAKHLKEILDDAIDKIVRDQDIAIRF